MTDHQGSFGADNPRVRNLCRKVTRQLADAGFKGSRYEELKKIVICMTPRSGSTYLSSVLRDNEMGRFQEHFRVNGGSLEQFVEKSGAKTFHNWVEQRLSRLSHNGIYGMKADWPQFVPLYYLGAYDYYFRDAFFIYLTRGDVMAQAISRYISTETGYFHSVNTEQSHTLDETVPLDLDKLTKHIDVLVDMQGDWERFFAYEGISPLRLRYEEIDSDPDAVIRHIATYCGLELPDTIVTQTEFERVRNQRNEDLRTAAIAEARARRIGSLAEGETGT